MEKKLTLGSFVVSKRLKEEAAEGAQRMSSRSRCQITLQPLRNIPGITCISELQYIELSVPSDIYEACSMGKIFELTGIE